MDNAWLAAFLGFLEGLTEFIPVSSTGHLLLAGRALGFESAGRVFEVAIQLGAVLALLAVYGGRILQLAGQASQDAAARRFLAAVLLAFLPAAALGVLAHDFIKAVLFETPRLIAVMLILGGVVLLFADRLARAPRWAGAEDLPLRTAFLIGCFQCLALIPGVSRSGATIVGGLLLGTGKRAAAEFSFYLSLPTMAGAVTYDLWKSRALLGAGDWAEIALGFGVAFVTALFVVRGLLAFVSRHGYAVFGWWRIALGLVALVFFSL